MEYFNRLFDVLGIVGNSNMDIIPITPFVSNNIYMNYKYYVSPKFNNYNKNYTELLKIMYKYNCKKYYKWDVTCIDFIKDEGINKNNIYILKSINEYDYQVFKVLLFLY